MHALGVSHPPAAANNDGETTNGTELDTARGQKLVKLSARFAVSRAA